ncbi:hypothetical protein NDK47_07275 [Brevibacillus ruminantium]|uniref:Tubby C-terminal domain-containing protein n=1 Tax=Brevibacillus ruminantium TaxID=2950604 RepID=A0ABY4WNV1_9BACL|nr:hypothetical protein [Brevibacillus ruminantium]USG67084.1 hypothetical protein NDK47_07275 [Brevibacillus ruminantium]
MLYLLTLFVVGLIGITLRFVIKGEFDLEQLLILSMLPIGAILVWLLQKRQIRRDSTYQPKQPEPRWQSSVAERHSSGRKLLYRGGEIYATYSRYYRKRWQEIFNQVIDGKGNGYLNLSFTKADGTAIRFVDQKESMLRWNEAWQIVQDGQVIGEIKTDFTVKNSVALQEGITLIWKDQSYYFKSFRLDSRTEVMRDQQVIAKGKRSDLFRSHYQFEVITDQVDEEEESILAMVYVLFVYIHK